MLLCYFSWRIFYQLLHHICNYLFSCYFVFFLNHFCNQIITHLTYCIGYLFVHYLFFFIFFYNFSNQVLLYLLHEVHYLLVHYFIFLFSDNLCNQVILRFYQIFLNYLFCYIFFFFAHLLFHYIYCLYLFRIVRKFTEIFICQLCLFWVAVDL